jgi:hypothetical protein
MLDRQSESDEVRKRNGWKGKWNEEKEGSRWVLSSRMKTIGSLS